jgi:hypothetical protein
VEFSPRTTRSRDVVTKIIATISMSAVKRDAFGAPVVDVDRFEADVEEVEE